MTSVEPPTYYFPGITFNSAFYETSSSSSSSGGLTQAQADALYLKKNTADTATALETFSGGISTNTISPLLSSNNITIGSTIGINRSVSIGRSDKDGLPVKFPSNIETYKIDAPAGEADTLFIGTVGVEKNILIGNPELTGSVVTISNTLETVDINATSVDKVGGILFVGIDATSVKLSTKYDATEVLPFSASIETSSTLTSNTMNFHSNAEFETTYDSRIVASGGTAVDGQGTLALTANSIGLMGQSSVNIMNGSATAGSVNIANGTGTLQTTEVNIGNGSTTGTVSIGNTDNRILLNAPITIKSTKQSINYFTTQTVSLTVADMLASNLFGSTFSSADPSTVNNIITVNLPTPTAAMKGMTLVFRKVRGTLNTGSANWNFVCTTSSIVVTSLTATASPTILSQTVSGTTARYLVLGFSGTYYYFNI